MNRSRYGSALVLTALSCCLFWGEIVQAAPTETDDASVTAEYEAYYDRLMSIENREGIAGGGFKVVEDQIFALEPDEEESMLKMGRYATERSRWRPITV